jgi:hypothetical protein
MAEERKSMTLPDEPKGWRRLQELAQQESDPQKLIAIIEEINRLLDEHDWGTTNYDARACAGKRCGAS